MIDLAAAKQHLRVEDDSEDTLIGMYLASAVALVETLTGKLLAPKEFTQVAAGFPSDRAPYALKLYKGPVSAITSIEYDPGDGSAPAVLADFRLVEGVNAALLPAYGQSWPATLDGPGTVRVTGTAGYADGETPAELDQAVRMLVGHFYANREAVGGAASSSELPLAVKSLISGYLPVGIA